MGGYAWAAGVLAFLGARRATRWSVRKVARGARIGWWHVRNAARKAVSKVLTKLGRAPLLPLAPLTKPAAKTNADADTASTEPTEQDTGRGQSAPAQRKEPAMLSEASEPEGMLDFGRILRTESETADEYADRAKQFADMAESELPLNEQSREAVRQYSEALNLVAEMGAEMVSVFAGDHAEDIERLESPRVNEEEWDASRNDV